MKLTYPETVHRYSDLMVKKGLAIVTSNLIKSLKIENEDDFLELESYVDAFCEGVSWSPEYVSTGEKREWARNGADSAELLKELLPGWDIARFEKMAEFYVAGDVEPPGERCILAKGTNRACTTLRMYDHRGHALLAVIFETLISELTEKMEMTKKSLDAA